jgi:uncharacterized protein (TIGR02996 family)
MTPARSAVSDRLGMIQAIHEQPDDELPRLAYADWLEEQGETDHAEFVRVEVRLSRLPREDPEYRALFARELELIRAYKDEWFGTWRHGWTGYEVRRGFIEEVSTRSPEAVLPCADWLCSHHVMQDLCVNGRWAQVRPLLGHPLAKVLARLSLTGPDSPGWSDVWHAGAALRRGIPLARRPFVLSLGGHGGGPALVEDLLASPCACRVTWLNLAGNAIGAAGLRRLLDGLAQMPALKTLLLPGRLIESSPRRSTAVPNVDRDGVVALANHPAIARLEEIDLSHNRIDADGVRALVRSPYLGAIRRLGIGPGPGRADRQRLLQRFGGRVELPREG